MKIELYLQDSQSGTYTEKGSQTEIDTSKSALNREGRGEGKLTDISALAKRINAESIIGDTPSKLTFSLIQDPANPIEINNGSRVDFLVDGVGFFQGYVFTVGTDGTGVFQVECYDQKRYLKNQDTYVTKDQTASDVFTKICGDAGVKFKVSTPSSYIPPPRIHDTKTYYQILDYAMTLCNIEEKKQYIIRDDYGTLEFTELEQLKLTITIGDESFMTNYKYEVSIDSDTYNRIKLVRDNKETKKREIWVDYDSNNEQKWGRLQYFEKMNEEMNEAQIAQRAKQLLGQKNRETKTLRLTSIGNASLQAGNGFNLKIDRLGINEFMWILSATHSFENDYHMMELEVLPY